MKMTNKHDEPTNLSHQPMVESEPYSTCPKQKKYVPYFILLGVILIPLLYSYFYLGAFWDPYAKLDQVPVAVVNEDLGATIQEKERNLGQELCDELKEDASLSFTFTDATTAKEGLEGKKYYATITIPSNFSKNIASSSESNKQTATITYSSNEKRNYLAAQILNTAVAKIEKSLRSTVEEEIVTTLSDKLRETPEKLATLSDGLSKLQTGASDLKDGTTTLTAGASKLKEGVSTLTAGTTSLKDGASSLQDGALSLQAGSKKLVTGSQTLHLGLLSYAEKWTEFSNGLATAKDGSNTLQKNLATLDQGLARLLDGATKLDAATNDLSTIVSGTTTLSSGANSLAQAITSYTTGVDSLIQNVSATTEALAAYAKLTGDPTITKIVATLTNEKNLAGLTALKNGSTALNQGASSLTNGITRLSDGAQNLTQLKAGITQLKEGLTTAKQGSAALSKGATSLSTGLTTLYSAGNEFSKATTQLTQGASALNQGLSTLSTGVNTLTSGAKALSQGADKLNTGASALGDGITSFAGGATALDEGATKLKDGISTAKDGVTTSIADANEQLKSLDGLDTFAANPVTVESSAYAPVPNYGTAFAPYFMSLSLWVGGLMIFFGIYFDPECRFKLLSRRSDKVIKRTFAYLLIGLLQAIFLCIVLIVFLGLKVENVPLYFASSCLVSMVFIAIIQLLLLFFSNIGKFLAIALLILQLTSCGGTFPMETVPKLFNHLFPFMPMTYSVGIFKEAISGTGDTSLILYHGGILLGILLIVIAITIVFSLLRKKKNTTIAGESMTTAY